MISNVTSFGNFYNGQINRLVRDFAKNEEYKARRNRQNEKEKQ